MGRGRFGGWDEDRALSSRGQGHQKSMVQAAQMAEEECKHIITYWGDRAARSVMAVARSSVCAASSTIFLALTAPVPFRFMARETRETHKEKSESWLE